MPSAPLIDGERGFFFEFLKDWWWSLLPWWAFLWATYFSGKTLGICFLFLTSVFWLWRCAQKPNVVSSQSLLLFFILSRLPIFWSQPFCEDDFYRYIWDGVVTSRGGNALVIAPSEVLKCILSKDNDQASENNVIKQDLNQTFRQKEIYRRANFLPLDEAQSLLKKINYPECPSIYGPVAQIFLVIPNFVCDLITKCFPHKITLAERLLSLRGLFFLLDGCFYWFFYQMGKGGNNVSLCLWMSCPLLLKEIGNSCHIDILPALLSFLAVLSMLKFRRMSAMFLLVLAIGVKPYALVLVPIFLFWFDWKVRWLALFSCLLMLLYLPWVYSGGTEIWTGLRYFSARWSMNDLYTALWREFFYHVWSLPSHKMELYPLGTVSIPSAQVYSRWIGFFSYFLVAIFLFRRFFRLEKNRENAFKWVSGMLLGLWWFSPVLNPWYLIWALPFFILSRHHLGLLFVGLSPFYLFNFVFTATSHIGHPFQWWVILPNIMVAIYFILNSCSHRKTLILFEKSEY